MGDCKLSPRELSLLEDFLHQGLGQDGTLDIYQSCFVK